MTDADVSVARSGPVGRLTLNRPAKMNALTHAMICAMNEALITWERDDAIRLVLVDGAGSSGLCAGGDIREVYESARRRDDAACQLWADEYRLDLRIATYVKPIVAFMSGIVMGGGVGISAHASHRIVTESTRVAMPEVTIGFIPDIGGTWLLSRGSGEMGTYLGLTGNRIGAGDAIAFGLADRFVAAPELEPLRDALAKPEWWDAAAVLDAIERFASAPPEATLGAQRDIIDRAFAYDTVEEIVDALVRDATSFARSTAATIATKSPTSLKLTLRALREGRSSATLIDCLRREYRVMARLFEDRDPVEGIRAAVVDKDRAPRWQPARLEDVAAASLDRYFASLGNADWAP